MTNKDNTDRRGSWTINSSTNVSIPTNGAPMVAVECLTSSSLTVTVQADFGSGTVRNLRSWLVSSTATETSVDPGTTTAVLAAQDVLFIPTCGAQFIQITRQAGDGTLASTAYGTDGLTAWMVAKMIDGGISVSASNTGNVAHDDPDSGNPIKVGGRARTSEITAVANNDRTDAIFDKVGKQITLPYANPENFVSGAISSAMTSTTSTSLIAAPASGLRNYITQITVSNAHATVGTDIVIQDGSGGTTLYVIPAAALYGGAVITFPTPLRQPTTATAIFCANVTTGASTKVSASGYIGA